jgi:hypothetical protein
LVLWLIALFLQVTTVGNAADLRARFEADAAHPRLILLLSPT